MIFYIFYDILYIFSKSFSASNTCRNAFPYLINKSHFLIGLQADKPRGMLEELEKSL